MRALSLLGRREKKPRPYRDEDSMESLRIILGGSGGLSKYSYKYLNWGYNQL